MKPRWARTAVVVAVLGASGWATASERPRRFALVVGQNRGIARERPLQYAHLDALNMAEVLRTAGGVEDSDLTVLTGVEPAAFEDAMAAIEQKIADVGVSDRPVQLIVYVSSHASRHRLHLNGQRFEMSRLRTFLQRASVDLGVLIVDTCEAGSITEGTPPEVRVKGAEPLRNSLPKVFIRRPAVKGRVIITSSGANEYSHESDALKGSVFTHHLIAGLRGVADVSRDGNVSLAEAYEYAYVRTVGEAAQHPNWEVLLRGQGDPILTTPQVSQGILRIDVPESGEWLLRSADGRGVLAEFEKGPGDVALAVPPGAYYISVGRSSEERLLGRILVQKGQRAEVNRSDLNTWRRQTLVAKGRTSSFDGWRIFANSSARAPVVSRLDWLYGATAGVLYDRPWRTHWSGRLTAAVGVHAGRGSSALRHTEGELFAGFGLVWHGAHPLAIAFGVEGGVAAAQQTSNRTGEVNSGLATHARFRLNIDVPLTSWLSGGTSIAPGVVVFSTPDGLQPLFQLPLTVGVAVRL